AASRFAGLLGACGGPGTRGAMGRAGAGCERCNGHGDTPRVPKRAPPGEIWYTYYPDDLGSVYPWDVDRAPCAIHSAKNFRMRGVVVSAVSSSVCLGSGCSCPPCVACEGVLHAPW